MSQANLEQFRTEVNTDSDLQVAVMETQGDWTRIIILADREGYEFSRDEVMQFYTQSTLNLLTWERAGAFDENHVPEPNTSFAHFAQEHYKVWEDEQKARAR